MNPINIHPIYRLSDKCPQYARGMNEKEKFILLQLQEQYCKRFDYCNQGTMYPSVEITIKDKHMPNFINKIFYQAFGDCSISEVYMSKIGKNNKDYDSRTKFKKYTWTMDKQSAKDFFSIFDETLIQPKLDKVWVHLTKQKNIFRSLTDREIHNLFHSKRVGIKEKTFERIEQEMLKGLGDLATCTWRRIAILFGNSKDRYLPYNMRLEYFENVNPITKTGVLKLNFFYQTYLNGTPLGILPSDKKRKECEGEKKEEPNKRTNTSVDTTFNNFTGFYWEDPKDEDFEQLLQEIKRLPGH